MEALKKCTKCGDYKINTLEYFIKTNTGEVGSMCKECKAKYDKEYREKNKEKLSKQRKEWELNNLERHKTNQKRWREENKEHLRKYREDNKERISKNYKEYRKKNLEHLKKNKKQWYEANKNHVIQYRKSNRERDNATARKWYSTPKGNMLSRLNTNRRRAKIAKLNNNFTINEWIKCKKYFNNSCAYCGSKTNLEQEHFIPVSNGGEFTKYNILPSCRTCNASKGNSVFLNWYKNYSKFSEVRLEKIFMYLREVKNET